MTVVETEDLGDTQPDRPQVAEDPVVEVLEDTQATVAEDRLHRQEQHQMEAVVVVEQEAMAAMVGMAAVEGVLDY